MTNKNPTSETNIRLWLAELTYTQQGIPADLVPYGIACVASYVQKQVAFKEPVRLFKYPEKLIKALAEEEAPRIMGFGQYVWNATLELKFAGRIKELYPDTIIIFGGPSFPLLEDERELFLRANPVIDYYVHGEGEVAFTELVRGLMEADFDREGLHGQIASVFSVDAGGGYHGGGKDERIHNLNSIPSPYLNGMLDEFFDGKLLPVVQTNRGCPFKCTFCAEGADYYNKVFRYAPDRIAAELDYIAAKMEIVREQGGRGDLFIADNNFGMYKQDLPTAHEINRVRGQFGWPKYINVATGKNSKARVIEVAKIVGGALRMGGSVQSLDAEVLKNVKRSNISEKELMSLPFECADIDGVVYAETILALPGDNKEKHFNSLRVLLDAGFTLVLAHQLRLTPGCELSTEADKQKFSMKTKYRAYPQCMGSYDILGEQSVTAEIEEICIGNSNMSFEDYLDCRKFHLLIHIFNNHSMFRAVIKFICDKGLSTYRWLEIMDGLELCGRAKELFDDYLRVVSDELWETEEELREFLAKPGVFGKFQRGELGYNVLSTFKARAMLECIVDLADMARESFHELMAENGISRGSYKEFLDDALVYHCLQMTNLFRDRDEIPQANLVYDMDRYIASNEPTAIEKFRFEYPVCHEFILSAEQSDAIERYLGVFTETPNGIGRMMAKVFVNKFLRLGVPKAA